MLSFLPAPVLGIISFILWTTNTILACLVIYGLALLKFLSPFKKWKVFWAKTLATVAECWISVNSFFLNLTQKINWDVAINCDLHPQQSYLILANHQSWVDIMVLQQTLNRKVPFMRFFIKKQLFWVPFLGLAWWALDFPFLARVTNSKKQKPDLSSKDLLAARKSCSKFRHFPTSILIFAEGTRFTPEKYQKTQPPYKYLLAPKSGGISTALEVMGDQFSSVLDVTIHYPQGRATFLDLLGGRIMKISVTVISYPVPRELLSQLEMERGKGYRAIKSWVQGIWSHKDRILTAANLTHHGS